MNSSVKHQFNAERKPGKMQVANNLILANCFTIEMLNNRELYPELY